MLKSHTSLIRQPTDARRIEARSPARVPSTLTAPSVPLGTTLNVVTKYLQRALGFQNQGQQDNQGNKKKFTHSETRVELHQKVMFFTTIITSRLS